MSRHVTAEFIADALGVHRTSVARRSQSEGWMQLTETVQGGRRHVYPLGTLPADVRDVIQARDLASAKPALPAPIPSATSGLKSYQRSPMDARKALVAEIDRMILVYGYTQGMAIAAFLKALNEGALAPELTRLIPIANARWAPGRTLSRATVYNWCAADRQAEGNAVALAPKAAPEADIPAWAPTFLRLWAKPQKPNITDVLDARIWPEEEPKPSYDQARRFVKRLDALSANKGRMGQKALMGMRAYVTRDCSNLWPGAVFLGDGHTYKAEIAHPVHGRPFRPEITVFLDVYTRRGVGWSAALAENTWSVADALRHAVTTTTCCDIVYYDNGSGAKNAMWDDDCTGLIARLGITKHHSAPWSSQARGIIERFNSTVLHKSARRGDTYVGERMDQDARRHTYKITRKDIAATGTSRLLPSWSEFLAEIEASMAAYNARPHSSLPKTVDPATGKRRHLCPNEMWERSVAEGWLPDPISTDEAVDLFRPAVRRKVSRCLVTWIGNQYFSATLDAFHGDEVMVSYDLHDASKVWVRALDGRMICEALWNGHKRDYFPVSTAQHDRDQRIKFKVKRLNVHADIARAEGGPTLIEHVPEPVFDAVALDAGRAALDRLMRPPEAPKLLTGRPNFKDDAAWSAWLLANPGEVTDQDRKHLQSQLQDCYFRSLIEFRGLDLTQLRALCNIGTRAV